MYELRFRQIHLDFHTSPYIPKIGARFDKKQWQECLTEAHVNSITCFSSCHHGWSYHPTKVGKMHPNLKFNLLRAEMDACKEIDINVPVYLTGGLNQLAATEHPEWLELSPEGHYAPPLRPGFRKLCFNTPYLDYLCKMISETTGLFPEADGIFIDIISQGECCCKWCMESMLKHGLDPEKQEDRKAHARMVLMNYYKRSYEAVKSVNPKMPIFHNSGNVTVGDHEILPYFSHLELESLPTGGWGYDHYPMSAAYSRNLGLSFLGMTGKFHRSWGEFGGFKDPNALRYECAAMIANNSRCSIGDQMHPDGELDKTTYEIIGKAYSEVEKCEPWCVKAHSDAMTAILAEEFNRESPANIGASRLLLENHVPFDIVDSQMNFDAYKTLIVAQDKPLASAVADKVRAFHAAGGKVVFAGAGIFKEGSNGKTVIPIHAELGELSPCCPDFIQASEKIQDFVKTPFLMQIRSHRLKVKKGISLGKVYDTYFNRDYKHFCSHQHTPYKPDPTKFDSGIIDDNVLYFAHPVFSIYTATGAVMHQKYVLNALNLFFGADRQVVSKGMPSVGRVTVMKQDKPKRTVIHLLYANTIVRGGKMTLENNQWESNPVEIIEELMPLRNTSYEILIPEKVKKVTRQPEGTPVKFSWKNGKLSFSVDEFTCHTMIVAE